MRSAPAGLPRTVKEAAAAAADRRGQPRGDFHPRQPAHCQELGVLPQFHIPAELSGLPSDLVSHTAHHHRFDQFRGRHLAVACGGSSAPEGAALLHEAGGEVHLVLRRADSPVWGSRAPPLTPLVRLRGNRLCEGWKCPFWNSPAAFRRLPQACGSRKP